MDSWIERGAAGGQPAGKVQFLMHLTSLAPRTLRVLQAIGLLDDLDKELNTYAMRVREWYGWHFPEMTKIVADNIAYAKTSEPTQPPACLLLLPRRWAGVLAWGGRAGWLVSSRLTFPSPRSRPPVTPPRLMQSS